MADIKAIVQRIRGTSDKTDMYTAEAFDTLQQIIDSLNSRIKALESKDYTITNITNVIGGGGASWIHYDITIPGTNHIAIDVDNGIFQRVVLAGNDVTFDTPIQTSTSNVIQNGQPLWVIVVSPNPATNKAVIWDSVFTGVADLAIDPTADAITIFMFEYMTATSTWEIRGYNSGRLKIA